MMVNRHKYFRWTGRTARITFAYMVAFPAFIGYLAYTTDVRSLGIREGEDLLMHALGQVGYEGEEEGRYYCGVLDGWRVGGGAMAVHMWEGCNSRRSTELRIGES